MKKIIIALIIALPLLSFDKGRATLYSSCDPCSPGEVITFTGDKYQAGRWIDATVTLPNGHYVSYSRVCIVDQGGNIFFQKSFTEPGDYDISTFQLNNNRFTYMTTIVFSIQ